MTEKIISFILLGIIAITLFIGLLFIVRNRNNKNIIYSNTIIGGVLFILFFVIYLILKRGLFPPLQIVGMITLGCVPLNVWPILSHIVFNDSYFEKTVFIFKKRYYYEDINSCSYREFYSKGGKRPVYTFCFMNGKKIAFGQEINAENFIRIVCKKHREFHNGAEIPGIEELPGYMEFLDRKINIKEPNPDLTDSIYIRPADTEVKERILLSAEFEGHDIVYRRVGRTNELVIDGYVYDEYIKLMETSHELSANVGGYKISAGFDSKTAESYIAVDGICVDKKLRLW